MSRKLLPVLVLLGTLLAAPLARAGGGCHGPCGVPPKTLARGTGCNGHCNQPRVAGGGGCQGTACGHPHVTAIAGNGCNGGGCAHPHIKLPTISTPERAHDLFVDDRREIAAAAS